VRRRWSVRGARLSEREADLSARVTPAARVAQPKHRLHHNVYPFAVANGTLANLSR